MSEKPSSAAIRERLASELSDLRRQLGELGFDNSTDTTNLEYDSNFADSSQVTAERGEMGALAASLRESTDDIEHALSKIDTDQFGKCENCGNDIASDRIEAMPTTRYCMECASKVDNRS